jgi:hypothetical protein
MMHLQLQYNFNPPFPLLQIQVPNMPILTQKVHKWIVIYAKDVENITGRKLPTPRKLLEQVPKTFAKQKDQFVKVREFGLYTGIDEDLVREFLLG